MSAIDGVQGGQLMMRPNVDKSLVFAIFPIVSVENKDEAIKKAKVAQAAPEMLEQLKEIESELLAIDWSEIGTPFDDGYLPKKDSNNFISIQLLIAKIGTTISDIKKIEL